MRYDPNLDLDSSDLDCHEDGSKYVLAHMLYNKQETWSQIPIIIRHDGAIFSHSLPSPTYPSVGGRQTSSFLGFISSTHQSTS